MLPILGSVLIVEDGMIVSLDLEDIFEDLGVRDIYAATSLSAAITKLSALNPTFVTLDLDLGDGSSESLLPMLQARAIPYIVISGQSETSLPDAFRGSIYVSKPVVKETILSAIKAASAKQVPQWAV